jgi:hypothetical protein
MLPSAKILVEKTRLMFQKFEAMAGARLTICERLWFIGVLLPLAGRAPLE